MEDIKTIEYKFSNYVELEEDDYHIVKELIHYKDGTTKPNIRIIKNFERPFWVTKPRYRRHKQKKEYEEESKLQKFMSRQMDLPNNIASKIGMKGYKKNYYRDVLRSPYLYGSDISSFVILSYLYKKKYGEVFTPYTVATLDIEADVDTSELTIISSLIGNEIRVCINKVLFSKVPKMSDEYIKSKIIQIYRDNADQLYRDIDINITLHDNQLEPILECFEWIHSKMPDFLSVWNISYDIINIARILESYDVDPKDVFSDPTIPKELRYYKFIKGKSKKLKADGTTVNIEYQDRWPIARTTASFIITDAMCDYAQIRVGQGKLTDGYGIDNVCKVENVKGKLSIPGTIDPEKVSKRLYHRRMSNEFPIEYCVYNIGDNTAMKGLDDATNDIRVVLPTLLGYSHHDSFNSGPTKIVDKLFVELLEDNLILGTKPYSKENDKVLGLDKWIITLEASRIIYDTVDVTSYNMKK
jgi:hypothetical protein